MATPDASPKPISLWLTDRTRYTTGTGRCRRQRYLTNHFGPTGYGIVRHGESLPLATGQYVHQALEPLWAHLQATDTFPTEEVIRSAVSSACLAYEKKIAARGYRGLLQNERSDQVVLEQQALLTGTVWAFCATLLPWIHQHYRLLEAEQETIYVLDCTCGLAPTAPAAEHDARGCQGIGQMLRQDAIAAKRDGSGLAYFEVKTTGWGGDAWSSQWETRPQLAIGSFGIEERLGQPITEFFIVGLYKGPRKTSGEGAEQIVRQDSPFCYGYLKAGNPPLATDDWKPAYEWADPTTGETKYARKPYAKAPVWLLPQSDWPLYHQQAQTLGQSPAEWWVRNALPDSVLKKQVFLVGPLTRQDAQIASLKRQIVGEERHWQDVLWKLYEKQQAGYQWEHEEFQQYLDYVVPASWDCQRFGSKYGCEMIPLCFKQQGWEDPLGGGKFVPRRPHHEPELLQAVSRGLLPAEAEEGEDEE